MASLIMFLLHVQKTLKICAVKDAFTMVFYHQHSFKAACTLASPNFYQTITKTNPSLQKNNELSLLFTFKEKRKNYLRMT